MTMRKEDEMMEEEVMRKDANAIHISSSVHSHMTYVL